MVHTSPRSAVRASTPPPARRRPVLGVTGLAIALVVITNLGVPLRGGYLATDVLLVAIGFDLARSVRRSGRQPLWLRHFWLRTMAGLVAPVAVALGLMALYWGWRGQLDEPRLRAIISGASLMLNQAMIFGGAASRAVEHLWLIAVIGQFVIVLPFLVAGARRYFGPDRRTSALVGLAIGVALCRFGFLWSGTASVDSIALNTLTRVDALLIGAAIGVCPLPTIRHRVGRNWVAPSIVCLLLLVALAPAGNSNPVLSLGVLTPLAIALAVIVIAAQAIGNAPSLVTRALDSLVLRWLGERAISIYVWHSLFGLALTLDGLTSAAPVTGWPGLAVFLARLIFSLTAATVSHRYLAEPAIAMAEDFVERTGERHQGNRRPGSRRPMQPRHPHHSGLPAPAMVPATVTTSGRRRNAPPQRIRR